ncbi:MAG: hypothetical protein AAB515_00635 [Patescibacteria group bacterium]
MTEIRHANSVRFTSRNTGCAACELVCGGGDGEHIETISIEDFENGHAQMNKTVADEDGYSTNLNVTTCSFTNATQKQFKKWLEENSNIPLHTFMG